MNTVIFPLINLNLSIENIAFSILGIDIYWYGIIIVTGIIIGLLYLKSQDGKFNIKFSDVVDLLIFLIPISIASARLYYVIFDISYFAKYPMEIFNIRSGGLAIYGGIIGGIITGIVFCKKRKIKVLDLFDYLVPALLLGQAIGRWGNFVNVEAYGTETTLPWKMGIYELGKYKEVHPTFLYESIANIILFLIISKISKNRKFTGQLTYLYLIGYGLIRMIIEGLRADSLMLGSIRISQLLSAVILIVGIILYKKRFNSK